MIPVSDNVRKLLLQAVESELEQLQIESVIPQADKSDLMSDDDYKKVIAQYKVIQQDLFNNRLVIFDTRPKCSMQDCKLEGRYSPIIFVFMPNQDAPIAQLDVQPPQFCCELHANGQLNKYLTKPQWREIQTQVQKQNGKLIHFNDAKIMYMDKQTGSVVPAPTPVIAIVN